MNGHDSFGNGALGPAKDLNPSADHFQPAAMRQDGIQKQGLQTEVSMKSLMSNLLDRVNDLEHGQQALRGEIEQLQMAQSNAVHDVAQHAQDLQNIGCEVDKIIRMQNHLAGQIEEIQQGGWTVEIGPFQSKNTVLVSRAKQGLTPKHEEPHANSIQRRANQIAAGSANESSKGRSLPPHLRNKAAAAAAAAAAANNALVTDGIVELPIAKPVQHKALIQTEPTPPSSPIAASLVESDVLQSVTGLHGTQSDRPWKPLAVTSFRPLAREVVDNIPSVAEMQTFSIDFLINEFGGIMWSPGLMFIPPTPPSPSMLKNRTYYTLDARNEPYLPKTPGEHGAKLTAFFNDNPEEVYPDAAMGCSFEEVPMFIAYSSHTLNKTKDCRYVYFGHYTQTRWSDKLDYDRMVEQVPQNVKEYWATQLSAMGRDEWVTEALKKHFFPKPEYTGQLPSEVAEGSVSREEQDKNDELVIRDLKRYMKELRAWEKDATLKTRLIKKDDILRAFDSVS